MIRWLKRKVLCGLGLHSGYVEAGQDDGESYLFFHCSRCGRDLWPTEVQGIHNLYYEGRELERPQPECVLCGDPADCLVPNAPGMGNERYCNDCCPRCNPTSAIDDKEESHE